MQILAIESSSLTAGAAIIKDDVVLAEYSVSFKKTHSQTLLPMIDEVVKMTETNLKELDAIAISAGPGSFTGLRIGSATAKGLCLALDKPLVEVSTLEAMAFGCGPYNGLICPMIDRESVSPYYGGTVAAYSPTQNHVDEYGMRDGTKAFISGRACTELKRIKVRR